MHVFTAPPPAGKARGPRHPDAQWRAMQPSPPSATPNEEEAFDALEQRLWRRRMRVTGWLLAVWFGVTYGVSYFARELSVVFLGWPFSFWVAAQGALLVYMALVFLFAHQMGRLDDERDDAASRD